MTDTAIRVENLSKRYSIGPRESYKALRDTLTDALVAPVRRLSWAIDSAFRIEGMSHLEPRTLYGR